MKLSFLHSGHRPADAIARHASALSGAHDVVIVPTDGLVPEACDVAIATDWQSTAHLFRMPATRYAFWVDHFAHRRMGTWQAERVAAQLAYDLPVDFLAAAPWIETALRDLRPSSRIFRVTSGAPAAPGKTSPVAAAPGETSPEVAAPAASASVPLRVFASGGAAGEAVAAAETVAVVDDVTAADVVVHLSSVDGVLDAPLRGFAAGATAVVWPSPDAADLVEHDVNGLVADADDVHGAARWLDVLARDRDLLARLRAGARETVAAWPAWDDASKALADALETILAEDPPADAQWPARLMADAIGGTTVLGQELGAVSAEVRRLNGDPLVGRAVKARAKLAGLPQPVRYRVSKALRRTT